MPHSSTSGRAAALAKYRSPDDPERQAVEAELATVKIARYVERIVDAAPPLTDSQRAELAALILRSDRGAK